MSPKSIHPEMDLKCGSVISLLLNLVNSLIHDLFKAFINLKIEEDNYQVVRKVGNKFAVLQ